jgi:hypothetical protein
MNVNNENVAERPYQHRLQLVKVPDDRPLFTYTKRARRKKNRNKTDKAAIPFKDWCMPEQPVRYLKANTYDCL